MELNDATKALACLGNETRLRVFRHLVAIGPEGDTPGKMAAAMGIPTSTMSFHLGQLEAAELAFSWRVGRSIRYAADLRITRGLLAFLVEDCCRGDPRVCGDLVDVANLSKPNGGGPATDGERVYNVLFLCTGNSARSIMAECILNRLGQGRFKGYSAGSHPKGEIHPYALQRLKNQNYPTANLRSKSWDEFGGPDAPELDFVFTVCDNAANEVCPVWPGQPMSAHWGVPDPAAATGTEAERHAAFADAMRFLYNRISLFVNLPMRSLDKLSLQRRLDEIGKTRPEADVVAS